MKKYKFDEIPIVYVAGAYRAPTIWAVIQNIRAAQTVAMDLRRLENPVMVFCPHQNSGLEDGAYSDESILDGDIAMLVRCDALVMIIGWENSSGATRERDIALEREIPVFYWPYDAEKFLNWHRDIWPKSKYYLG